MKLTTYSEFLHTCIKNNNLNVVKYIIDKEYQLILPTSLILTAIKYKSNKIAKILIDAYKDDFDLDSLFIAVCYRKNLEMVKYLISLGANIHTDDDFSLIAAVESNDMQLTKYLIEHDVYNDQAFIWAEYNENHDIINYFLENLSEKQIKELDTKDFYIETDNCIEEIYNHEMNSIFEDFEDFEDFIDLRDYELN
jgi:ankyrin repeat protein